MNEESSEKREHHSKILGMGVEYWNDWRRQNPNIRPNLFQSPILIDDLRNVNFENTDLGYAHFNGKDCQGACFKGASLYSADLRGGNFKGAKIEGAQLNAVFLPEDLTNIDLRKCDLRLVINLDKIDFRGAQLQCTNLRGANMQNMDFSGSVFDGADLRGARFVNAKLNKASFSEANLFGADFHSADLTKTCFTKANFGAQSIGSASFSDGELTQITFGNDPEVLFPISQLGAATTGNLGGLKLSHNFQNAKLSETDFSNANFVGVNLVGADFRGAIMKGASFKNADLTNTNLEGVDLAEADLRFARMIRTNIQNSILNGCKIFGISVWEILEEGAVQTNLLITNSDEEVVAVDSLEVGQFIYLILNNHRIKNIIDTITSKVVLILGRFTTNRKRTLELLRVELRKLGYCPVLFDFEKPASRDLTESVSTLAHLARFIVADLTDAKAIPQELQAIIPNLPSVPVQPILAASKSQYSMFEHYERYSWVLPIVEYCDDDLVGLLRNEIIPNLEHNV